MRIEDAKNKDAASRPRPQVKGATLSILYNGAKGEVMVHGAHTGGTSYVFRRGEVTIVPKESWSERLLKQPGFTLAEEVSNG